MRDSSTTFYFLFIYFFVFMRGFTPCEVAGYFGYNKETLVNIRDSVIGRVKAVFLLDVNEAIMNKAIMVWMDKWQV